MIFMPDHLPPLAALRALEAAARHGSFTRAAAELNVSQSAISHQIRHLEGLWGLELFARGTRPLALTKSGAALAPVARDFFQSLGETLETLRAEAGADWSDLTVVGDIFELDLVVPLVLGARVILLASEHTPAYELDYLEAHPRGQVVRSLREAHALLEL